MHALWRASVAAPQALAPPIKLAIAKYRRALTASAHGDKLLAVALEI
jgi:hypothetical protein